MLTLRVDEGSNSIGVVSYQQISPTAPARSTPVEQPARYRLEDFTVDGLFSSVDHILTSWSYPGFGNIKEFAKFDEFNERAVHMVEFDPALGYPSYIYFGRSSDPAEEAYTKVTSLKVLK